MQVNWKVLKKKLLRTALKTYLFRPDSIFYVICSRCNNYIIMLQQIVLVAYLWCNELAELGQYCPYLYKPIK